MSILAGVLVLLGAALTAVAALGLVRFSSPYARFHAAGKASPIAFVLIGLGASVELGAESLARLLVAIGAMALTLPVGVHTLFRATHRSTPRSLDVDELYDAEEASAAGEADGPPA